MFKKIKIKTVSFVHFVQSVFIQRLYEKIKRKLISNFLVLLQTYPTDTNNAEH